MEPISGSVGIIVPPKGYLKRLREICDRYEIILIFDEVVTGWGRTGSMFASEEFDVTPDIITLAKATTNGIMPMGVVAVKDKIYDSIINNALKAWLNYFMAILIQESLRLLQLVWPFKIFLKKKTFYLELKN